MRRFGIALILAGACGYYVCSRQLAAAPPMPPGLSIEDSLRHPAGRYEVGEYLGAILGGIGLLFLMFPQGR